MIPITVIILIGCIFIALCVFCTLLLIKLDDVYRLLKLPGTRVGGLGMSMVPEEYEEVSSSDVRKQLDEKTAAQIHSRPRQEEHIQSFTQELGEEIIVEDK